MSTAVHPAIAAAAAPLLAPGLRDLGRLRRGEDLDVHDAWCEVRDCRVVAKTLRPDRPQDGPAAARLRDEADLLLRLSHPHLVRAFALVQGAAPVLVLETLDGETLAALIEREQGLHPQDVAELGSQIASALAHLHQAGVLHLDLKPSNVICTAGTARLIDLSIARPPGRGIPHAGTTAYMAPEQRDGRAVRAATDVFGLAGLLVEAAIDAPPPPAGTPVTWPRRRRPPAAVRALLGACRAPGPADRPPLPEVAATLRRHVG